MEGTLQCTANHNPLSPLTFLERAAVVYGDQTSVVYSSDSSVKFTWKETRDRCLRLASGLAQLGISRGDLVAILAPNVPATYEAQFGVPMAGAVICTLNTSHDPAMVCDLLTHSDTKIILVDHRLLKIAQAALDLLLQTDPTAKSPLLVVISNPATSPTNSSQNSILDYETLVTNADPHFDIKWPIDELDPISISYTSGTTSRPKGVVYSHRGAYLNAISTILLCDIMTFPVYLWTVPMFHCNGWCLAWGMAARGGTNVCIRDVDVSAKAIFDNIACHKVTHMGGAPAILNMIANSSLADRRPPPAGQKDVAVLTGGAPPPAEVLAKIEELGFNITHAYGMTETYGAAAACTWKPEWDDLPADKRAKMKSRQGVQHTGMAAMDVKDPFTMESVPADGQTVGEVMFQGNTVMSGYYKDLKATEAAFAGGWFRTGDFGVKDVDGYIQYRDRSQDAIVSDGKNISTIEVESLLYSHPAVFEAAVVGRPDELLGETPCAFVHLKDDACAIEEEIIRFCHAQLPDYMAPKRVVFGKLPKTSTGKTKKFVLREKARALGSLSKKSESKL